MDNLFERTILAQDCGYLESLISNQHMTFKELYPDVSITMKIYIYNYSMIHMYTRIYLSKN